MAMQQEAIFEAPVQHEATHFGQPETSFEWEHTEASHYAHPEATHFGLPYANPEEEGAWGEVPLHEEEADRFFGAIGGLVRNLLGGLGGEEGEEEVGWEHPELQEADRFFGAIGGLVRNLLGGGGGEEISHEFESEEEADRFFGGLFKKLGGFAKGIARRVAGTVGSMLPGGSQLLRLLPGLLREGEVSVHELEAHLFGQNEALGEVAATESAHEAAMGELLAAQAAEAGSEAEATALVNAALPFAIVVAGPGAPIRPVVPVLAQASGRLTRVLRRRGPVGRELLRAVPTIQRQTLATLHAARRAGRPITAPLAVQAMAGSTQRVLGNPRTVTRSVLRNAALQQRYVPPHPRRTRGYPSARATARHFRQPL